MEQKYIVHTLLKKSFKLRGVKEEYYVNIIRLNQLLCKKNYPEYKLHLHADKYGIEFMKKHQLLNYDTISISKISNILDSNYKNLFAAGKIELFSFFDKPFIHIDLDLFLLKKIDFEGFKDIIIAHFETVDFKNEKSYNSWKKWYYDDYLEIIDIDDYLSFINLSYSANFSIFGTLNKEHIEKINNHYSKILKIIEDNHSKLEKLHGASSILEQLSLNKLYNKKELTPITDHFKPNFVVEYGEKLVKLELRNENYIGYNTDDNHLLNATAFQKLVNDYFIVFNDVNIFHLSEKTHAIMNELICLLHDYYTYGDISGELRKYELLNYMKNHHEPHWEYGNSDKILFLFDNFDEGACVPNLCKHSKDFIEFTHDNVKYYSSILDFLPRKIKERIRPAHVTEIGFPIKNSIYPIDVLSKYILSPTVKLDRNRPQITTIYDDITLSPDIVKLVKNKQTKIVFFYFTEGYFGMTDVDFQTVDNLCKKYDFDPKDVVVLTANLIANEEYENYVNKFGGKKLFTIHEINYFFKCIWFLDIHTDEDIGGLKHSLDRRIKQALTTKKEKLFLNYNRRPHYHRIVLATELLTNENLKYKGWTSLGNRTISNTRHEETYKETIIKCLSQSQNNLNLERLTQYWEDNSDLVDIRIDDVFLFENQSGHVDLEYHHRSFLSVVSETIVEPESVFFSEKVAKPIYCCQPFILFSSKGSLKKLKDLGYKTFSDFWDESYDEETNYLIKIEKIVLILEDLAKKSEDELMDMLKKMEPILRHNYLNLINGIDQFDELEEMLASKNSKFI